MADKAQKPKKLKSKPKKGEKGVLAALPSTRPERIGTRRTGAAVPVATATESAAARTAPKPKASKPAKAATSKPATAKAPKPAASESSYPRTAKPAKKAASARKKPARPAAARRKAAAPRTFEPTQAAEAAAGRADERAAGIAGERVSAIGAEPRPRPVREGAPGMGTTSPEREQPSHESGRPSGVELATTAVRAAGELTQIALTIGGRIIKRAVDRIPRP